MCRETECRLDACWRCACSDLRLHVSMWQLAMCMDMAQAGGVMCQRPLPHMTIVRSDLDACNWSSLIAETMVNTRTEILRISRFQ